MGAAAEGRRAHFWMAAEGRHFYLSKTEAKLVFLWPQILPGPFFDNLFAPFDNFLNVFKDTTYLYVTHRIFPKNP